MTSKGVPLFRKPGSVFCVAEAQLKQVHSRRASLMRWTVLHSIIASGVLPSKSFAIKRQPLSANSPAFFGVAFQHARVFSLQRLLNYFTCKHRQRVFRVQFLFLLLL